MLAVDLAAEINGIRLKLVPLGAQPPPFGLSNINVVGGLMSVTSPGINLVEAEFLGNVGRAVVLAGFEVSCRPAADRGIRG